MKKDTKQKIEKTITIKSVSKKYPSAILVKETCADDYKRLLDTYDKVYEKVNIALVLCGVLLPSIVITFDYTKIQSIINANNMEMLSVISYLCVSLCSVLCMVWAIVQLLILMRSKKQITVDTVAMRNNKIYDSKPEEAAMWLIDKYTIVINDLKQVIGKKQHQYDSALVKVIISVITYALAVVISKGVK